MRVLIAASEFSPWARTGGLGEAVAGIAHGVASGGHHVTAVIPRYRHLKDIGVPAEPIDGIGPMFTHDEGNVQLLLVDDPVAFDRAGIYGDRPGTGYDDQWVRFGRFSNTVRQLAAGFDVLHLHDAHTGAAALGAPCPTVFTIHNAAYPIIGPLDAARALVGAAGADAEPGGALEWYGEANFLKAGMVAATVVTTVSPSFATQLLEDPTVSNGLHGVLRARSNPIVGIINGIDPEAWDAETDPMLPKPYSSKALAGKKRSRKALLEKVGGLDPGLIFGNVGRMTEQKGLGLLEDSIDELVAEGARFVLAGSGELDDKVDAWAAQHPNAVWHGEYNEQLNRLIVAGSDAYLMPSRFEPCGIGQMYAMRYGSVPVVRLTGGLADTVIDLDERPGAATGFGFRAFDPMELTKTIRRAMRIHADHQDLWTDLQRRGMETDFSWAQAARRYVDVYGEAIGTAG
ncbi:MAG: glycogen/starch synthase [Acidimicrobiia bacterium]|nr:glycogen/starch synthase [Acidimicrobiia bacterium]